MIINIEHTGHASQFIGSVPGPVGHVSDGQFLQGLMFTLVYVDQDGRIVGNEGDDYQPREGDCAAWVLHA